MMWKSRRSRSAAVVTALALAALAAPARAQTPSPCDGATAPPWPVRAGAAPLAIVVRGAARPLPVLVAADEPARERGLMCVRDVPHGTGMLFAFTGGDVSRSFWMKNTLVPLDMVFVARDGRVTSVAAAVPATTVDTPDAAIPQRAGVAHLVIELRSGEAARLGIRRGTRLRIAAVPAS